MGLSLAAKYELQAKVARCVHSFNLRETSPNEILHKHAYYCGIDLQARAMYLCILDQDGQVLLHRNMKALAKALISHSYQ